MENARWKWFGGNPGFLGSLSARDPGVGRDVMLGCCDGLTTPYLYH